MRIVCSGGGTGGHIFPAVAVAQEVKKRYPDADVLFIGAKGKMEMTKVPKAGFPIKGLWISGLQRRLTLKNLLFPFKVSWSVIEAYAILKKFKPDLVAGFGGYASGAALWVASKTGIPTLILEQNSYAGMTNKMLNGNADVVCLAYQEAEKYFDKSRTILTGNPVRKGLKTDKSVTDCRLAMNLDPLKQTILIVGGSLGAKSINETLVSKFEEIHQLENIQFIWQCGSLYFEDLKTSEIDQLKNVHLMAFIEDMSIAYGAADLVVCRAGALTITELQYLGKPAILVPSPNVAEDHQTKNAKALVDQEAAIILKDSDLKSMIDIVKKTLEDEVLMNKLSANIKEMNLPNAVDRIVDEIENLISDKGN